MKLKPYKVLLTMSKEAIDKTLAPVRAASQRKKAELEVCKLEERMATLEKEIDEECSKKEIDYEKIINQLDDLDLAIRRHEQFTKIINELFPE